MFSGISEISAGSLQAAESRIQQIEGMLRNVQTQPANAASTLNPAGVPTDSTGMPKPFQFYLQNTTAPSTSFSKRAEALQPTIETLSDKYGVDKNLINAVIKQESGFNPNAVSKAGATGLMQLMPSTAKGLGVNPQDPTQNLDGGVRYLKGMLDRFNGNIPLALAAYNAGAGAVQKYKGVPPYEETQNYVRNILNMYLKAKQDNA